MAGMIDFYVYPLDIWAMWTYYFSTLIWKLILIKKRKGAGVAGRNGPNNVCTYE
jgi:hypothetical protein